jgi:1,4-dihydroxy-2-naphthoate polyprenyltransferase
MKSARPSTAAVWVSALRPKTLGASLCPVLIGGALAYHDGVLKNTLQWKLVCAAFVGACLLQIASNFANDLFDGVRGTDSGERLGPTRAVGGNLVTPRAMSVALCITLVFAVFPAWFLASHSGIAFAIIGACGAIAAVGYTAPPFSLAYRGLGDLFVFVFFGPIAVAGTRAACDGAWTTSALVCGVASGAIAVCLLATNNLRDRVGDLRNGKRTLAVRFGARFGRVQIYICHAIAFVVPIFAVVVLQLPPAVMLASFIAIVFAPASITIARGRDGATLNKNLAMFGVLLYIYGVAFALGMWIGGGVK